MNALQNLKDFEQNLMVLEIANNMMLQMPFQYCIVVMVS